MSTILVVDDMAVFREPIAAALRRKGYDVVTAGNGREALDVVRQQSTDLILLDVAMPVMDGLECLRALRSAPTHCRLPVILLTAVTERDYVVKAARLGIQEYMLKSRFSLDDLYERVANGLSRRDDSADSGQVSTAMNREQATAPERPRPDGAGASDATEATAAAAPAPVQAAYTDAGAIEALKSIKSIVTRSEVYERVEQAGELKALSPAVGQLMKLTGSPNCSIDQVAKIIKQDQAIALKVLRLANSVVYQRGDAVESVQQAVMRVGLAQIRQLVMNISVIDRFNDVGLEDRLDSRLFWEHSIGVGLIAAAITRARGAQDADVDSAFTMGLLHDVGRMVFADALPDIYPKVFETADRLRLPLEQVESRMMMVNHSDVMDNVLRSWRFPKHLINPIAMHHLSMSNIRNLAARSVEEVATLGLANRLAHGLLLGSSGSEALYATHDFVTALKLKESDMEAIEQDIPDQTDDIKFVMLQAAHEQDWPVMTDDLRRRLSVPARPIFAGAEPKMDAYRMIVDRLRDPTTDEDQPPNLALVHLRNVRDRADVGDRLRQAEYDASVRRLPAVIISPKGNINLDDATMADRPVRHLTSPTPVARMVEAINELVSDMAAAA